MEQTDDSQTPRWPNSHPAASPSYTTLRDSTAARAASATFKRGYGLRRSRLEGDQGQRIWTGWAILAYNLDTLAIQAA